MTCILGVQLDGVPHIFADTRITTGDLYIDGVTKVFKVNTKVLVGVAGNACVIDLLKELAPKLQKKYTALSAARALEHWFDSTPRAKDVNEFSLLFLSRNQAVVFEDGGVLELPFNDITPVSAGSGGVLAQMHWDSVPGVCCVYQAERAVRQASRYRVDCGSDVEFVSC